MDSSTLGPSLFGNFWEIKMNDYRHTLIYCSWFQWFSMIVKAAVINDMGWDMANQEVHKIRAYVKGALTFYQWPTDTKNSSNMVND